MAENERALSFYERLGYRNEGVYFQARGSWDPDAAYDTRASSTPKRHTPTGKQPAHMTQRTAHPVRRHPHNALR